MSQLCWVGGCTKPSEKRGMCGAHYYRWNKHGDPLAGRTPNGEAARFLRALANVSEDRCIEWPYGRNSNGYPARLNGVGYPHRFACEQAHGAPPFPSAQTAHSCGRGNKGCVNPRHLRWATARDNLADRVAHGTMNRGERAGGAKLSANDVREIRRLAGSVPNTVLAEMFGVRDSQVSRIHTRKTWAWLED